MNVELTSVDWIDLNYHLTEQNKVSMGFVRKEIQSKLNLVQFSIDHRNTTHMLLSKRMHFSEIFKSEKKRMIVTFE